MLFAINQNDSVIKTMGLFDRQLAIIQLYSVLAITLPLAAPKSTTRKCRLLLIALILKIIH